MPEYSGSLQHVELSSTLWLIPALPLLAGLVVMALGRRLEGRLGVISGGAVLATAAALGYHAVELASLAPPDRFLLAPGFSLARIGTVDLLVSFALDPLGAAFATAIVLVGLACIPIAARTTAAPVAARARLLGGMLLAFGAVLVAVLADNLFLTTVGSMGAALGGWLAVGSSDDATSGEVGFAIGVGGDALFVAGAAVLFWAASGEWTQGGDFVPAFRSRLASVEPARDDAEGAALPSKLGRGNKGQLTMTALPGARVTLGGAKLCAISAEGEVGRLGTEAAPCRVLARSPFVRLKVPAAIHDVRVSPGGGSDDVLAEKVRLQGDQETQVVTTTGSLVYRDLANQLEIRDQSGDFVLKKAWRTVELWGVGALSVIGLLLLFGAVLKAAGGLIAWSRGPPAVAALLVSVCGASVGGFVVLRLGFLVSLSQPAMGVVALMGAVVALVAAAGAVFERDGFLALARLSVSQVGVALVGVGVGALVGAAWHLVSTGIAVAAAFAALIAVDGAARRAKLKRRCTDLASIAGLGKNLPTSSRAFAIAALGIVAGPIPGTAAFFSKDDILRAAFATDRIGWLPGWVAWGLVVAAGALGSLAVWRIFYVVYRGTPVKKSASKKMKPEVGLAAFVPLAVALVVVLGGVLALSDRYWGGDGAQLASTVETFLAPSFAEVSGRGSPMGAALAFGQLAAALALVVAGWAVARARYGERDASWVDEEAELPGHRALSTTLGLGGGGPRVLSLTESIGRAVLRLDAAVLGVPAELVAGLVARRHKPSPKGSKEEADG